MMRRQFENILVWLYNVYVQVHNTVYVFNGKEADPEVDAANREAHVHNRLSRRERIGYRTAEEADRLVDAYNKEVERWNRNH